MSDTTTAKSDVGFPPVPLLANSYNLQDLEAAAGKVEGIDDEAERTQAFGQLVKEQAVLQDVVEGQDNPALPEGTELADVEDAQGRTVHVPVAIAAEDEPAEGKTTSRRRKDAPATDTTASG